METGKWSSTAVFVGVVALLVIVGVQSVRLDAARARAMQAGFVADTLEATRDSSRVLSIEGAALGDSLSVVQRRAIQAAQNADALDKALGLERVAREQLKATIIGMRSEVRSDTVAVEARGDSVRTATFDIRQSPYTVHADATLPRPPGRARLDVRVDLDTLALDVRIGCGAANAFGVRSAQVSVSASDWANIRLGRLEQAAGVCATAASGEKAGLRSAVRSFIGRFGVSVGYSATRLPSGSIVGGIGVGMGVKVWP